MNALMRIMSKLKVTRAEVDAMNAAVMDALSANPLTKNELGQKIKPAISKGLKLWMKLSWNAFRSAIIEGLICYGPDRGRECTFVRTDQWLPRQNNVDEQQAKRTLFRWCLGAYGPATLRDVSRWSGIPISEAKAVWQSLNDELREVSIEGQQAWIRYEDVKELSHSDFDAPVVRLLPHFDPYMLAHANKAHLVDSHYYKRVYRNQGWLTPVVLLDGRVAGVWSYERSGKMLPVRVELFQKLPKAVHARIEEEAEIIARFMGLALKRLLIG